MRIGIGFPQVGVGEYSRFDSDWNHSGGAAYLRFSSEQRRTRLRTGRYVLEMETAELAQGRIQGAALSQAKKDRTIHGILLKLDMGGYSIAKLGVVHFAQDLSLR